MTTVIYLEMTAPWVGIVENICGILHSTFKACEFKYFDYKRFFLTGSFYYKIPAITMAAGLRKKEIYCLESALRNSIVNCRILAVDVLAAEDVWDLDRNISQFCLP